MRVASLLTVVGREAPRVLRHLSINDTDRKDVIKTPIGVDALEAYILNKGKHCL